MATSILGRQARPLRNLLFRLMDSSVPDEIQEVGLSTRLGFARTRAFRPQPLVSTPVSRFTSVKLSSRTVMDNIPGENYCCYRHVAQAFIQ